MDQRVPNDVPKSWQGNSTVNQRNFNRRENSGKTSEKIEAATTYVKSQNKAQRCCRVLFNQLDD